MTNAHHDGGATRGRPGVGARGALAGLVMGSLISVPPLFAALVATAFGDGEVAALEVPFVVVSVIALAAALPLGWLLLRGSACARPLAAAIWSAGITVVACAVIVTAMVLLLMLLVTLTVAFLWSGAPFRPIVWTTAGVTLLLTLAVSIPTTAAFARGLRPRPSGPPAGVGSNAGADADADAGGAAAPSVRI